MRKSKKRNFNITTLRFLNEGEKFEIVGLEGHYRSLYVKSVSESSVCIGGEMSTFIPGEEKWKRIPLNYCIALSCKVRVL